MGNHNRRVSSNHLKSNTALRSILEGTAAHTGKKFFRQLVKHLALVLGTNAAWITEYLENEQKLRALAFWIDGKFIEGFEYPVKGTPCETVIGKNEMLHVPANVITLFPDDPYLQAYNAMSYMGAPLLDTEGKPLGNLAIMDIREMPKEYYNVALFRIFADRGASELRRLRTEQKLREREEQLRRLFNSAMDAIIEFNPELRIIQANVAALQLFEIGEQEKMVGHCFKNYLVPESLVKLKNIIKGTQKRAKGKRNLWVPGGFMGINSSGETFQFEATLSCYKHNRNQYFNLILRNVTDRIEAEKRIDALSAEAAYLRQEIETIHNVDGMVGESEGMFRLQQKIRQVAPTNTTVLVSGETGTGKELVARAIHAHSNRKNKPLIKVNCSAIPENLMESELFGHEKGAFTGATHQRKGRFLLAHSGTIFLDEIGDLPMNLQPKLLRVLQEGEFEPVGSSKTIKVNCRVIAASNRDLNKMIRDGEFRADLYYRLNVFPILVSPLRDRGNDILLLARTFVRKFSQQLGIKVDKISKFDALSLMNYDWPGNVRELQNIIERSVITSQGGELNLRHLLKGELRNQDKSTDFATAHSILTAEEMQENERENMIHALEMTNWKVAGRDGAARLIGIPPSTFSSRMKTLGIKRPS